jgi:hypothetical protein
LRAILWTAVCCVEVREGLWVCLKELEMSGTERQTAERC